ncbi:MAG: hypothetical protein Q7W05_08915 [Deltaproteobacteria bacterium]|nr:hypothetical protein [Deltaproteobacteria bacterium]
MKRFLLPLLFFVLGVSAGVVSLWLYFGEKMSSTLEAATAVVSDTFASSLYIYEINEANEQFSGKNRDVTIYALDRAVRKLSSFQAPGWETCRKTAYSLGKFNVRLAGLYGEQGNQQAREAHLEKAIASYEAMGWELKNIEELERAIPLIEAGKTVEALKLYGKLVPSCLRK